LGLLPVPAGAKPWSANTNALMSRVSFVKSFYDKSDWTMEEALLARRGFVAAVWEGWNNADGSHQSIMLVRFATPAGATSDFDAERSYYDLVLGKQEPKPVTLLADSAIRAVGWSSPTLDSVGNAKVEFAVVIGDTEIVVDEWTAATPDPAAAKVLLQRQYDSLKNGS
jgi:hypothetical protein